MGHPSPTDLLVLHAVRVRGMADSAAVVRWSGLPREVVEDQLLDDQARGWVQRVAFADLAGWSLTESGRVEEERLLADELTRTGERPAVEAAHDEFAALNAGFLATVTRWQLRPAPGDALAANDHTDFRWDDRVLNELASYRRRLAPVCARLAAALDRFEGYEQRFGTALDRVAAGQRAWVDQTGVDSCHTVWIQLHEDLIATLGLERGERVSAPVGRT